MPYDGAAEKILSPAERQAWSLARRRQIEQKLDEAAILFDLLIRNLAEIDELITTTATTLTTKPRRVLEHYSRMDQAEKDAIIADFRAGKSARKIADERGRSVATITSCLKKAGVARTVPRGLIRTSAD